MRFKALAVIIFSVYVGNSSAESVQRVLPETSTTVTLSNRDANRLVCESGEAVSPVWSTEKPVDVKIGADHKSFYVKFKILRGDSGTVYYSEPTELYLTCGNSTFELVINPKYEDRKKVLLGSATANNIKENQKVFSGLALEEAALQLTVTVLKDATESGPGLPDTFAQKKFSDGWTRLSSVPVEFSKVREISVEGVGLRATQYSIRALRAVTLDEKMFLSTYFGRNIFAMTLESLALAAGETSALVVIEREGM
ncbi:type-F conjugative transfer system secretin TraK [Dickeya sp. NCPPB 3274]|uniref:TraK domain-containing protein n=1 Tax=Dickeya sp. NCPPB 3274 TaxID=568766 RepID=UPI0005B4AD79|nr:type-F conjugative transfer system secretin TraK [Dickeya sp. NCPPB 3274]